MSVVEISIRKMLTKYSSCTHSGALALFNSPQGVVNFEKKSMTICLKQNIKAKIFKV